MNKLYQGKKNQNQKQSAKQISLYVVVPSRHKADSASHSDLPSVCHSLLLTTSRASSQKKNQKCVLHPIAFVFLYIWLVNLKICMLNSKDMLPYINRPKNKMQNEKNTNPRSNRKDAGLLYLSKRRAIVISLFPCSSSMKNCVLTDLKYQIPGPPNNLWDK